MIFINQNYALEFQLIKVYWCPYDSLYPYWLDRCKYKKIGDPIIDLSNFCNYDYKLLVIQKI